MGIYHKYEFTAFRRQRTLSGTTLPILTLLDWENVSSYVVSINVAGCGITYNVTSGGSLQYVNMQEVRLAVQVTASLYSRLVVCIEIVYTCDHISHNLF